MSESATPARMHHLLVVEDDEEIAAIIRRYFSGQGFVVLVASDGRSMRTVLAAEPIDAVLLDLGLPGEDGLTLMRYLRESWSGAVIMLTGRSDSVDRIVGLELGADDYVTKPFDLRELLARVRSVLRRTSEHKASRPVQGGDNLRFASFTLNTAARTLLSPAGTDVPLTSGEFELLAIFVSHPERVLSRDELMTLLHGHGAGPFDRAVDVGVGRLRRKLEENGAQDTLIRSVRGAGYLFASRVERGDVNG
ncbi:MAG: response regulator transcription factor [Rudaea sp.]